MFYDSVNIIHPQVIKILFYSVLIISYAPINQQILFGSAEPDLL